MLRALRLGAGLILFRAKSYRGQNAPSVSQTRFAPFVGARKRNAERPAWAQAKRPVCLTGMLRGLRLGAGLILFRAKPAWSRIKQFVSRAIALCRPAWAQIQPHVKPAATAMFIANGRTVYRYSPANPAFFRWQSSWNAQAQRATLESSSHRPAQTKEKATPCLSLQKAAAGRVFGDFTHTERPSSRPHRPPIPASRSASSWSLCMQRHARSVLHLPH